MSFVDVLTTARFSCNPLMQTGGHPSIASQAGKFVGIRNGIDPELWSPEENVWLPRTYDAQTVVEGKAAARKVREGPSLVI